MVLGIAYGAFCGIALVYIWGYKMVSYLTVFLDDTLVFGADLVIENLEVDLVASQREVVRYGVVDCNAILVLLGLEGGDKDCVGVAKVGDQYVLIIATILDGQASSVISVKLVDWFELNDNFV